MKTSSLFFVTVSKVAREHTNTFFLSSVVVRVRQYSRLHFPCVLIFVQCIARKISNSLYAEASEGKKESWLRKQDSVTSTINDVEMAMSDQNGEKKICSLLFERKKMKRSGANQIGVKII